MHDSLTGYLIERALDEAREKLQIRKPLNRAAVANNFPTPISSAARVDAAGQGERVFGEGGHGFVGCCATAREMSDN